MAHDKAVIVCCSRSKNRAASPPSICTWWNWNETGKSVLNQFLRYLPHITHGLRNFSVYWLTKQSSSVCTIADVPIMMWSSRKLLSHSAAALEVNAM